MADEKTQGILERLQSIKDELTSYFEDAGLGKDLLLRTHGAIDEAHAVVAAAQPVEGYDLNKDLAESPEDHPAVQGQVSTPIETDPDVNQQAPVDPAQPVVSGAPQDAAPPAEDVPAPVAPDDAERRVGADGEPHAPTAG